MFAFTESERAQLLSAAPFCDGVHAVLVKFFSSHNSYLDDIERVQLVVRDLALFWKNVKFMRKELGFHSHEEVFMNVDEQGALTYLTSTQPYKTNPMEIVKELFNESSYDDMRTLIADLFNLWGNIQKIIYQRGGGNIVDASDGIETSDDDDDDDDDEGTETSDDDGEISSD